MKSKFSDLLKVYSENKKRIKTFLASAKNRSKKHLLTELMFCLLTSQTKAKNCRTAVCKIDVINGNKSHIKSCLKGIRFSNNKSEYLFYARKKLPQIKKNFKLPATEQREWLVNNIKGMGMKLASHYLRNIGIFNLAILDVHVQRYMKENYEFIGKVGALTKKQYLENEKLYFKLSKKIKIAPEELDIAIWMLGNSTGQFYG